MQQLLDQYKERAIKLARKDFYYAETGEVVTDAELDDYYAKLLHDETGIPEDKEQYRVFETAYIDAAFAMMQDSIPQHATQ